MPDRKQSASKGSNNITKRIGVVALVLLAVVATGLFIQSSLKKEKIVTQKKPLQVAVAEIQEPTDANSEISGKYYGLCKKNSIHSVEDFRRTVQNDAVLSAHFADFNWESAKLGKQDNEVWSFVSYRKDEIIRQTSKPVRLPKGDKYISDGVRKVRTYCCNDYDIAPPPTKVSLASIADPVERVGAPPRHMTNKSEVVAGPPRQLSSGSPAEDSDGAIPEYMEKLPNYPVSPKIPPHYSNYSSHKHIVTPEPGTLNLMGAGVMALSLFCLFRRKRT